MAWNNISRGNYLTSKGETYFRSKWEANYALYLDWLIKQGEIKDWEYEPERYRFWRKEGNYNYEIGNGYLPDFKVVNKDNTFYLVEIKGYKQGMMKLKRMAKHYPDIKIELVEAKEMKELKNKLGRMLNFY